jgi:hypothetical protein
MGSFSYTLKCKLQPLNCLTLIGTEGSSSRIAFARRAIPWSSRWRRTQASSSRRSAEERKPGRIMGIAESFQAQPSSHQIRLPQDSEYSQVYDEPSVIIREPAKDR